MAIIVKWLYIDETVMEMHAQNARSGGAVAVERRVHSGGDDVLRIRAAGLVEVRHELSLAQRGKREKQDWKQSIHRHLHDASSLKSQQ